MVLLKAEGKAITVKRIDHEIREADVFQASLPHGLRCYGIPPGLAVVLVHLDEIPTEQSYQFQPDKETCPVQEIGVDNIQLLGQLGLAWQG